MLRLASNWTRRLLALAVLAGLLPGLAAAQGAQPRVSAPFVFVGGPGNQGSPHMAGNMMVYATCVSGNCDIWATDLTTRQTYPLAVGLYDEQQPSTDGLRVVWRDGRSTDSKNGDSRLNNFDIHGVHLEGREDIAASSAPRLQNRPSVWGSIVAWADFRGAASEGDPEAGDIYMYQMPSGNETLISGARSAQVRPVTNGKVVVWVDYRNEPNANGTNSDIYAYDLTTRQEFVISNAPDTQTDPAISGNIVVWADFRAGSNDANIYGYDLSTKREFLISNAKGAQVQPGISGNIVVWADFRNEPDQENGTNSDIYAYDLTGKREFPVHVGPGPQNAPRTSSGVVAWEDTAKGVSDSDIHGATISGINIVKPDAPPFVLPGAGSQTFIETGKTAVGIFFEYWQKNGGLPQQGFPISDVMREVSDLNGRPYMVQYFERAVFEYHPEEKPPYKVLLSQLGTFQYKKKYSNGPPNQKPNNEPGSQLFAQTGKRVGGKFLDYWNKNGGLAQQGYPISDEFQEWSDLNGQTYTVQYFERAVFEYHPENAPPYDVLLSQLGTFQHKQKYSRGP